MKNKLAVLILLVVSTNTYSQIVQNESLQSLYIEVFHDSLFLGKATGFVIKSKTQNYLITNWHVATNRNPKNFQWIDLKMPLFPNTIKIVHHKKELGNYSVRTEKLVDDKPQHVFKEFYIGNEAVDVVAIPMKDTLGDISIFPVDYKSDEIESILLKPTERLFVIGYPLGIHSAPFFPIWKSGLIASEPELDQESLPIIWLDIESFGGMSGSPVYLISEKVRYKESFKKNEQVVISADTKSFFYGVFSHKNDANVGALWKGAYLKRLFNSLP